MAWTEEQKLDYLLVLPWTIYSERSPEGERLLRVRELPSVIGSGDTEEEMEQDFWDSLEATLRSYLHFDDEVPLPALSEPLPWKQGVSAPAMLPRRAVVDRRAIDQPETAAVEHWEEKKDLVNA